LSGQRACTWLFKVCANEVGADALATDDFVEKEGVSSCMFLGKDDIEAFVDAFVNAFDGQIFGLLLFAISLYNGLSCSNSFIIPQQC